MPTYRPGQEDKEYKCDIKKIYIPENNLTGQQKIQMCGGKILFNTILFNFLWREFQIPAYAVISAP